MACNSCTKPFSLLRKEKGCPGCGFSYCSKCLNNKVFLKKHNSEVKVCLKCSRCPNQNETCDKTEPPDTFYKRSADTKTYSEMDAGQSQASDGSSETERIQERLQKLKGDRIDSNKMDTNDEIASRLQKVKGEMPSTSDAELYDRLAKLKGVPVNVVLPSKTPIVLSDQRTEQEQADDLLKQYTTQAMIDVKYKEEFDQILGNIENRLTKLKGSNCGIVKPQQIIESDDEEESVNKIIEKVKAESLIDNDDNNIIPSTNDELPFCEICNEDARVRCLGCQYLFCKRCFLEHKDDDDGCDKYEVYAPPNHHTNI